MIFGSHTNHVLRQPIELLLSLQKSSERVHIFAPTKHRNDPFQIVRKAKMNLHRANPVTCNQQKKAKIQHVAVNTTERERRPPEGWGGKPSCPTGSRRPDRWAPSTSSSRTLCPSWAAPTRPPASTGWSASRTRCRSPTLASEIEFQKQGGPSLVYHRWDPFFFTFYGPRGVFQNVRHQRYLLVCGRTTHHKRVFRSGRVLKSGRVRWVRNRRRRDFHLLTCEPRSVIEEYPLLCAPNAIALNRPDYSIRRLGNYPARKDSTNLTNSV